MMPYLFQEIMDVERQMLLVAYTMFGHTLITCNNNDASSRRVTQEVLSDQVPVCSGLQFHIDEAIMLSQKLTTTSNYILAQHLFRYTFRCTFWVTFHKYSHGKVNQLELVIYTMVVALVFKLHSVEYPQPLRAVFGALFVEFFHKLALVLIGVRVEGDNTRVLS